LSAESVEISAHLTASSNEVNRPGFEEAPNFEKMEP